MYVYNLPKIAKFIYFIYDPNASHDPNSDLLLVLFLEPTFTKELVTLVR